jgi:hypothetical protein
VTIFADGCLRIRLIGPMAERFRTIATQKRPIPRSAEPRNSKPGRSTR